MLSLHDVVTANLLICPRCAAPLSPRAGEWLCANAECQYSNKPFPVVSGVPALIDFDNSVIDADRLRAMDGASDLNREMGPVKKLWRALLSGSNQVAPVVVARMVDLLLSEAESKTKRPRLLIVGGGAVGSGLESLYSNPDVELISFDIYASPFTQFVGDGHSIPLADGSIDGVIIQAVLEHVVDPGVVARELSRVLRSGGLIYADTPFMQQVHEGPYDFTRFTDSGHRYLFRNFEHIDSGATAGAGTALTWSIEYFVRALTRSVRIGQLARACFFWLRAADKILDPSHSLDAASGIYFFGRKTNSVITQREIIRYYRGATRID